MSIIADFYLLPRAHLATLVASSADPERFDRILEERAAPLPFYESGIGLMELDQLLESRDAPPLGSCRMTAESERASAAQGRTVAMFDHDRARAELAALEAAALTPADIDAYATASYASEGPDVAHCMAASLAHLRAWLASIEPDAIGVMIVG